MRSLGWTRRGRLRSHKGVRDQVQGRRSVVCVNATGTWLEEYGAWYFDLALESDGTFGYQGAGGRPFVETFHDEGC